MATRRSFFTTTGRQQQQQIGGLRRRRRRRRRSNRVVGARNNNNNINNKNVFDESSTTTETSSNYEEDNERKKLNVAIVGAGFAGLSCAYNVIRRCSRGEFISSTKSNNDGVNVTVFAAEHAGQGGASSIAAGLLHQRTPKGSKMPYGSVGYAKTLEMLEKCQKIEDMMVDPDLNVSGIDFRFSGELRDVKRGKMFRKVGCLKPARTEKDAIGIRKNVLNADNNTNGEEKEEDAIRFVEREEIEVDLLRLRKKGEEEGDEDEDANKENNINNACGFFVENGIVVDAQRYLEALKVLIEFEAAKNAHANVSFAFKKRRVESLEEIANESFDAIVLCCGGEILRDGFLDDSTKRELFEKVGGTLELQAGRALVLERENCFVREDEEEKKWEMPGILGSHYLSPFQKTKAMFGPTKERGEKVKPGDAAKAGYYSTEAAKTSFPNTPETIDFLLRELNEKVYPKATTIQTTTSKNEKNFFSIKDIDTVAYGVRVNGPRTPAGRFPKIVQFDTPTTTTNKSDQDHHPRSRFLPKKTSTTVKKVLAVTAVGARGLLYHALLGEWVAAALVCNNDFGNHAVVNVEDVKNEKNKKDNAKESFETIVPEAFR
jgi:glycine/D-amino acid oxidase-like deaminating enzyme